MCMLVCCVVCYVLAVWVGHVFISGHVLLRDGSMYACLYMMTGWSPVMDDSIDACVFRVFLLYIIIIINCLAGL